MNRPVVPTLILCLLANLSLAGPLLESFRRGTAALGASVAALPDDQVGSLDALRGARTAFGALSAAFAPELEQGLGATFRRAEQAIVNGSETDLAVQVAVLRGGFRRAAYEEALRRAADGDLTGAQSLLNVLGRDLGFAEARFAGGDRQALQGAFEGRLAALALARLERPGGDLGSRYRTLSQVYSYVFLVQDSPRLPPETRTTVLNTIRALVEGRPVGDGLALLRGQLERFARNAEASGSGAGAVSAPRPGAQTAQAGRTAAPDASAATSASTPTPPTTTANTTVNTAATPETPTVAPLPEVAEPAAAPEAFPNVLGLPLPKLLLVAAGLLALLGLAQLLTTAARNPAPRQGTALALLLLPAAAEGLVTLATLFASYDLPFVAGLPLARAGSLSLFTNPTMQLVWAGLTAAAVLCLAAGGRTAQAQGASAPRAKPARQEPPKTAGVSVVTAPAERAPAPSRPDGAAASTLRWDDDF